jgi:hypothetical protein
MIKPIFIIDVYTSTQHNSYIFEENDQYAMKLFMAQEQRKAHVVNCTYIHPNHLMILKKYFKSRFSFKDK